MRKLRKTVPYREKRACAPKKKNQLAGSIDRCLPRIDRYPLGVVYFPNQTSPETGAILGAVTPIRKEPEYLANCPKCRCKYWLIRLDSVNDNWQNIIGTECSECGFFVDWVNAS